MLLGAFIPREPGISMCKEKILISERVLLLMRLWDCLRKTSCMETSDRKVHFKMWIKRISR